MSARYEHFDSRGDAFEDEAAEAPDREISLGTTTILGIFVALALVCGVFFGFGYSMGRRSTTLPLGAPQVRAVHLRETPSRHKPRPWANRVPR